MKDEFIITLLNNKKYKIKNVKKISIKKTNKNRKYVSTIDEKICAWSIK